MDTISREKRWGLFFLVILLGTLFAITLSQYLLRSPFAQVPVLDGDYYWRIAVDTATLGKPLPERFFSSPFYPLFLTAIVFAAGKSLAAVYAVQLFVAVLTILLVYRTARRLFSTATAIIAAAFMALYFPFAYYALKILPEVLSIFLLSLFLFLYTHPKSSGSFVMSVLLGLVGGLAILARFQFIAISLPILIWRPFYQGTSSVAKPWKWRFAASSMIAFTVPVLMWGGINWHRSGSFSISPPNGGVTFYEGNNPNSQGTYTPIPGLTNDVNRQKEGMIEIVSKATGRSVTLGEADRFFWDRAFAFIQEQPLRWISLEWKKALLIVRLQEIGLIYNIYLEQEKYLPVHRLFIINWGILMTFALLGLVDIAFLNRHYVHRLVPMLWTGMALVGILLSFFVVTRYRILLLPVVAIFASHGATSFFGWIRGKKVLLTIMGALLVGYAVFATFTAKKEISLESLNNLAYALIQCSRFHEAEEASRTVLTRFPGNGVALNNLVSSLVQQHRYAEARAFAAQLAENPLFEKNATYFKEQMEKMTAPKGHIPKER